MNKLLRANFSRLGKSRSFWIGMAVMLAFSLGYCLQQYRYNTLYHQEYGLDTVLFAPYIVTGILIAVFCSIFIGKEYGNGTIRNKLVVGHSRSSVYLANFITVTAAGLLMNLVYTATACALGIPLLGSLKSAGTIVLIFLLSGLLLTVALSAVFSMLALLNQNPAFVALFSTLGIFLALILAGYMYSRMQAPEFIEPYSLTIDGVVQAMEPEPNPNYLNDTQRSYYQFVMDLLPTGQAIQIAGMDVPHPERMPLFSALIIAAANIAGVYFFRRKDLK